MAHQDDLSDNKVTPISVPAWKTNKCYHVQLWQVADILKQKFQIDPLSASRSRTLVEALHLALNTSTLKQDCEGNYGIEPYTCGYHNPVVEDHTESAAQTGCAVRSI